MVFYNIKRHTNIISNEEVDQLAKKAITANCILINKLSEQDMKNKTWNLH